MFRLLISSFIVASFSQTLFAKDDVATWLQRMGCIDLQAIYLEKQLENGDRGTQVKAAKQLADVYATMLARADQDADKELLQRAIDLFDRIPSAGTFDLRLQLYRATFIAAEQILERYRLRISAREEAQLAITQLQEVAENLNTFRQSLLKRVRSSRSSNEKLQQQLGMVTSYLAWTRYYIAWFQNDRDQAEKSAQLFADILLGEHPTLQSVSLDLKQHESGARAILGIALCKSIIQYPADPDPWFEELDDPATLSSVRILVPLWKYFLLIDQKKWGEISDVLETSKDIDRTLMYRVAAVHSLENYSSLEAKDVAQKSLAGLIELGQLGILSDIVKLYGTDALEKDGFISYYIEGDIEFRHLRKSYTSDEPATNQEIQLSFAAVAEIFNQAIHSFDIEQYAELVDDCHFMLGLTLYYSSQFEQAAEAFVRAAEGEKKEQAIWMAIVCLNYLDSITNQQQLVKDELSNLYLKSWPNTEHATQLTIQRSSGETTSPSNVEDLLAIPHSDPKYEDAQRQASRSLYQMWQSASHEQRSFIGNRYITVAMPLMITDFNQEEDADANEVSAVRALRILEISLHQDVRRLVAFDRALTILDDIKNRNIYSLQDFQNEILFRKILYLLIKDSPEETAEIILEMIERSPNDHWTTLAGKQLWNYWTSHEFSVHNEDVYAIGSSILRQLKEHQYGNREFISIASKTTKIAFQIYLTSKDAIVGKDALRISRILVAQQSRIIQLLLLNAELETELGDKQIALQRWKLIASGSQSGTEAWLQARLNTILLLSEQSPEKALACLNQHQILYPNYGKDPYGSKLRELHNQLRGSVNGS